MTTSERIPVLIVGGGPVGLVLGIELARLGIHATLVEARDGTIKTPKMNFVNVRTMEFCRRWGITDEVRRQGHPENFHPNVMWATGVEGYEIARLDFPPFMEEKTRFFSPAADCLISQLWFDPILLAHARKQPNLTLRHRTRLDNFRETAAGIEADVTDLVSGKSETVAADYIVGCDGANSTVRDLLGIQLSGLAAMQDNFHIFLESQELIEIFEQKMGEARFFNLVGPDGMWAMFTSINWRGRWRFSMHPPPKDDERAVPSLLRRAVGRDFEYTLLDSSHWISRKLVADTFRRGRAFIAGDAAHQLNPSGGFGMNTGVADAMDLAWKLAGTLQGWGGPALLESYEIERRPIAVRNVEEATRNFERPKALRPGPQIGQDTAEGAAQRAAFKKALFDADILRHHDTDGIALGYRYDPSPIVVPDGTAAPSDAVRVYTPTARPGHRAPHAWLDGGPPPEAGIRVPGGRSTIDLYGIGFALLDFGAPEDAARLAREAAARGVPVTVTALDDPVIAKLYGRKLVLVRPDGHVAWRADAAPADCDEIVDRIRGAAPTAAARAAE